MPTYNCVFLDPTGRPTPLGLQVAGPRLPVSVSVHPTLEAHLVKDGKPVPQPVVGIGLIDTGATFTAVDNSVVAALGIPPIGLVNMGTAGGQRQQSQYPAALSFPGTNLPQLKFNFVVGCDLAGQDFKVLIGRDVLIHFTMFYNGPFGQVVLSV